MRSALSLPISARSERSTGRITWACSLTSSSRERLATSGMGRSPIEAQVYVKAGSFIRHRILLLCPAGRPSPDFRDASQEQPVDGSEKHRHAGHRRRRPHPQRGHGDPPDIRPVRRSDRPRSRHIAQHHRRCDRPAQPGLGICATLCRCRRRPLRRGARCRLRRVGVRRRPDAGGERLHGFPAGDRHRPARGHWRELHHVRGDPHLGRPGRDARAPQHGDGAGERRRIVRPVRLVPATQLLSEASASRSRCWRWPS